MSSLTLSRRSPYFKALKNRKSITVSKTMILRKVAEDEGTIVATTGYQISELAKFPKRELSL